MFQTVASSKIVFILFLFLMSFVGDMLFLEWGEVFLLTAYFFQTMAAGKRWYRRVKPHCRLLAEILLLFNSPAAVVKHGVEH